MSIRWPLAIALVTSACAASSADCPEGTQLVREQCRPACERSTECAIGEICEAGACVQSGGPREDAGGSADSGLACARDEECGEAREEVGMCGAPDLCATRGMKETVRIDRRCQAGVCADVRSTRSEACERATEGVACGPASEEPWSECETQDECRTAERSRALTTRSCKQGACIATDTIEKEACDTVPDGIRCGPESVGPWSTCEFTECGRLGSRSRVVTKSACRSSACTAVPMMETDRTGCQRQVLDGTRCGNGGMCCSDACVSPSSPENCGVCGVRCETQRCVEASAGRFMCSCGEQDECSASGYGADVSCARRAGGGVCACSCGLIGNCTGGCPSGACEDRVTYSACTYP